jgi:hypothetical protein
MIKDRAGTDEKGLALQTARQVRARTRRRCINCGHSVTRHSVEGLRLCCECYIGAGYAPAEWHPECMTAARAQKPQP